MSYAYAKRGSVHGEITVPGSKSETIRGVLFGMLSDGETVVHNPLPSKDGLAALYAARAYGAEVVVDEEANTWTVQGLNGKPKTPDCIIDTMNSGTTTSFVTGIASLLTDGYAVITGDEQIRRRPWRNETNGLIELGATCIHTRPNCDCPPLVIKGPIHGGVTHVPGFNSQHISGILVPSALLPAGEEVTVEVSDPKEVPYVQITIDWMSRFGVEVTRNEDFTRYYVKGGQTYKHCHCLVASDWSGVAFPLVAAVITNSELVISGLNFNNAQGDKAVVDVLIEMGANITKDPENNLLVVHPGSKLHGIEIDMNLIPDALPALTVAAAYAEGDTHFTSVEHVRVKETDRVAVMHEVLTACGADVEISPVDMTIHGGKPLHGADVDSHDDHRVAMAMCVCALAADGEMRVSNAECAAVSFPGFYDLMNKIGAGFELREN